MNRSLHELFTLCIVGLFQSKPGSPAAEMKLGSSSSQSSSSPRTSIVHPHPRAASPCLDDFVVISDILSDSLGTWHSLSGNGCTEYLHYVKHISVFVFHTALFNYVHQRWQWSCFHSVHLSVCLSVSVGILKSCGRILVNFFRDWMRNTS